MIKPFLALSMLAAAITFTGCATSYQPKGLTGGYVDEELGDGLWQVEFLANTWTSREKVEGYADRRAKELCGGNYEIEEDNSNCAEFIQLSKRCEQDRLIWIIQCTSAEQADELPEEKID